MLCEKCKKNEATVFYRENINGKVRKYSLCSDCAGEAEKNGELDLSVNNIFSNSLFGGDPFFDPFFKMNGLLSSMFASGEPQRLGGGSVVNEEKCPLCGAKFSDLVNEGMVGCPKCYDTFRDKLAGTINRIHGGALHTGRAPKLQSAKRERKNKLEDLKKQLKTAIDTQEFENAAKLRDEIKSLEANA